MSTTYIIFCFFPGHAKGSFMLGQLEKTASLRQLGMIEAHCFP